MNTPFIERLKLGSLGLVNKTGTLPADLSPTFITCVLGFLPHFRNRHADRMTMAWEFTVGGEPCAIWDFEEKRWSCHDPGGVLPSVFAAADDRALADLTRGRLLGMIREALADVEGGVS